MKKSFLRVLAFSLVLIMCLGLCACSKKSNEPAEPVDTPVPTEVPIVDYDYASELKTLESGGQYLSYRAFADEGIYATGYDNGVPAIYLITEKGKISKLNSYAPVAAAANDANWTDFDSGVELQGLTAGDSNIYVVECVYKSGMLNDENQFDRTWYLRILDKNGTEQTKTQIINEDGSVFDASGMKLGGDGNIYLLSDYGVAVIGPDGAMKATVMLSGIPEGIVRLRNGNVAAVAWVDGQYSLNVVDADKHAFADSYPLPNEAVSVSDGAGDFDFYYTAGTECYGYSILRNCAVDMFNWTQMLLVSDKVSHIATNDGKKLYAISNSLNGADGYTCELATITRYSEGKAPKKNVITLASAVADSELQEAVVNFNRSSKTAVKLVKFDMYGGEEENIKALNDFVSVSLGGVMPDIIDLTGLNYSKMASAGAFEDLTPYLDKDKDLSKDSIMPNVLSALTVNDKLYCVTPGFGITTIVGRTSDVGEGYSWNYDQYKEVMGGKEGFKAFPAGIEKADVLWDGVGLEIGDGAVNWADYSANIDNQEFLNLVLLANEAGTADEQSSNLLDRVTLYTYADIVNAMNCFNSDVSFIGYPVETGSGNYLSLAPGFAMSASCADKDTAWTFLRTFLTEDYQKDFYRFPSNKAAFENGLAAAKQETYENGENGDKIPVVIAYAYNGDDVVEVYALTDEMAEKLLGLVENTGRVFVTNQVVYEIAEEASREFFEGTGAVEDVVMSIQEQVSTYINAMK